MGTWWNKDLGLIKISLLLYFQHHYLLWFYGIIKTRRRTWFFKKHFGLVLFISWQLWINSCFVRWNLGFDHLFPFPFITSRRTLFLSMNMPLNFNFIKEAFLNKFGHASDKPERSWNRSLGFKKHFSFLKRLEWYLRAKLELLLWRITRSTRELSNCWLWREPWYSFGGPLSVIVAGIISANVFSRTSIEFVKLFPSRRITTVKKKNVATLELNEKSELDDNYDPFAHRKVEHPTTWVCITTRQKAFN